MRKFSFKLSNHIKSLQLGCKVDQFWYTSAERSTIKSYSLFILILTLL